MVMTDSVADMLTRIRNAIQARKSFVDIPSSHQKVAIAEILTEENYIRRYRVVEDQRQGVIRVYLRYYEQGKSTIRGLKKISKPGRRVYAGVDELPRVMGGMGIAILSTNKGIITDRKAKELKTGGEVICYIW
jgi:small subunit ribosomal protein S8